MAKRTGLGRGLDGMFTSYLGSNSADGDKGEKETKPGSAGKTDKPEKAAKAGKAGKTAKSEKQDRAVRTEKGRQDGSDTKKTSSGKGGSANNTAKGKEQTTRGSAVSAENTGTAEPKEETIPEYDVSDSAGAGSKRGAGSEAKAGKTIPKTGNSAAVSEDPENGVTLLRLSLVEPNREQPRKEFQEEGLNELAASIRQYGILQPLVVQKRDDYYEIIAGERRWRAARLAGLKEIPVIIKDYTDQEIVEVSLIENIQREDLNPIEEAMAYQRLLDEFALRQEDIAKRVSKNRSTITNSLRLLKLDERVRDMLSAGELSAGHARALLGLENKEQQFEAAKKIAADNLSVRDVEKLIRGIQKSAAAKEKVPKNDTALDLVCQSMENELKAVLGTQVHVNRKNSRAGRIEIEYYSMEELERIYDQLRQTGN